MQDNFSWIGVAAAGIGTGIGGAVLRSLSGDRGNFVQKDTNVTNPDGSISTLPKGSWQWDSAPSLGAQIVSGAARTIAEVATHSAMSGENFGRNLVRALPSIIGSIGGQALGDRFGFSAGIFGGKDKDGIIGVLQDALEAPTRVGATVGSWVAQGVASIDRNIHADRLLDEIAPNGATPGQRQHVKDMLKVRVADGDITPYYAQGLDKSTGVMGAGINVQVVAPTFDISAGQTLSLSAPKATLDLHFDMEARAAEQEKACLVGDSKAFFDDPRTQGVINTAKNSFNSSKGPGNGYSGDEVAFYWGDRRWGSGTTYSGLLTSNNSMQVEITPLDRLIVKSYMSPRVLFHIHPADSGPGLSWPQYERGRPVGGDTYVADYYRESVIAYHAGLNKFYCYNHNK